ncbi:MAG: hypothetical protein QG650_353 [Patescibacteria group bacterium]|nr:hypothetical protein [Patescibacteria group bacterium]
MNSQELKGENHETYERFFSKNETVVSGCFSMPWSNELIDHLSHFPLVRSKLPLRCYVGFSKRAEDGVVLDTVIQYEGMERGFVEKRWGEVFSMKESMEAQLSQYLKSIGAEGGYSISLLSEVARGRSIGFTETIFATLSYGIHHLESPDDTEAEAASGISEKSVIDLAWALSLAPR